MLTHSSLKSVLMLGVAASLLAACGDNTAAPKAEFDAASLAADALVVDTHIDVPYRVQKAYVDVTKATEGGDFDYPRAVAGGLNAPFMSIYTPADLGVGEQAFEHAEAAIKVVEDIVASAPDKFVIAASTADVRSAKEKGLIALPLGMENGSPIGTDLANLNYFYEKGVRYITLAHSKANQISDSSYDPERPNDGLTDFGHAVVARMNSLGIMVDVSHISDKAFYDVIAVTKVPVIASHSSARHFTPGFERNMDDDMIRTLAENGGVIMINYGSSFITQEANGYRAGVTEAYKAWLAEQGKEDTPEREDAFEADYKKQHPYPFADISDVLDHIDHVVKLVGVDYVGLGSDYDGVGDSLPVGLKDVSSYPALAAGLHARGYTDADIRKILGENLMRVWSAVENYAASHAAP